MATKGFPTGKSNSRKTTKLKPTSPKKNGNTSPKPAQNMGCVK